MVAYLCMAHKSLQLSMKCDPNEDVLNAFGLCMESTVHTQYTQHYNAIPFFVEFVYHIHAFSLPLSCFVR